MSGLGVIVLGYLVACGVWVAAICKAAQRAPARSTTGRLGFFLFINGMVRRIG